MVFYGEQHDFPLEESLSQNTDPLDVFCLLLCLTASRGKIWSRTFRQAKPITKAKALVVVGQRSIVTIDHRGPRLLALLQGCDSVTGGFDGLIHVTWRGKLGTGVHIT